MRLSDLEDRATITVEEAGDLLGLSRNSAYAAAKREEIPTLRLGRRLVVPVPALLHLLGADSTDGRDSTDETGAPPATSVGGARSSSQ